MQIVGKVFYMPMPVDINGAGPATSNQTVKVLHEVWDESFTAICTAPTEVLARMIVGVLNEDRFKRDES